VLVASAAIVGAGLLGGAAIIGRYRQQTALEQFMLVPVTGPMLFSHPGGMPDTGHSGRATNVEDYTDPYGGGDVPGPYGYVNDPYDGDWALGPLGGKGLRTQNLRFMNQAPRTSLYSQGPQPEPNIWGAETMGTNSLIMPRMTASDVKQSQDARAAAQLRQPAEEPVPSWVGTNVAFFGAHQGGDSSFSHPQPQQQPFQGQRFARPQQQNQKRIGSGGGHFKKDQDHPKLAQARTQALFRSDDPHAAEYGLEGDNVLDDDVLPSAVGTGGPVIGVDGEPSNLDHAWEHYVEPMSFACNPDILGCENGLTVEPEYADDLKGVDY